VEAAAGTITCEVTVSNSALKLVAVLRGERNGASRCIVPREPPKRRMGQGVRVYEERRMTKD
jgi:phosphatidylserine decarboxylase